MNNDITTLANQVKMALAHFACPPSVEVKNGEILIDGGSISICPDDRDQAVKTLRGRVNIESHGYSITVANAIPGLLSPNGVVVSPPDVDVTEIAYIPQRQNPQPVITKVLQTWFLGYVMQQVNESLIVENEELL